MAPWAAVLKCVESLLTWLPLPVSSLTLRMFIFGLAFLTVCCSLVLVILCIQLISWSLSFWMSLHVPVIFISHNVGTLLAPDIGLSVSLSLGWKEQTETCVLSVPDKGWHAFSNSVCWVSELTVDKQLMVVWQLGGGNPRGCQWPPLALVPGQPGEVNMTSEPQFPVWVQLRWRVTYQFSSRSINLFLI